MEIRKYLFWICENEIRTYKAISKGEYEILRPLGNDYYRGNDWDAFSKWFKKNSSITSDEYADFCFIMNHDSQIPDQIMDYRFIDNTTWCKEEIICFIEQFFSFNVCEVVYSSSGSFFCQNGNISDKNDIKKVFIKCIPTFEISSDEIDELSDQSNENTSKLNLYFSRKIKRLKE